MMKRNGPPAATISVTVKLFASLREAAGQRAIALALPSGATVADLMDALDAEVDGLRLTGSRVYAAVNHEYAHSERQLADGDEVALFPPVSGG